MAGVYTKPGLGHLPYGLPYGLPQSFNFTSYKEKYNFLPVQGSSAGKRESILSMVSIKYGLRITDYGLRTGYKTRTRVWKAD